MPADNGLVLTVVDIAGGTAAIDTTGDGVPESSAVLDTLGITVAERQQLAAQVATRYAVFPPHRVAGG